MSSEKTQASGDTPGHPYLSNPPHYLTYDAVINELGTNSDDGLTATEARQRIEKYGENMLEGGEGVSFAKIIIRQVANAMMLVSNHTIYATSKRIRIY
jgi:Na+-exporting ATPase